MRQNGKEIVVNKLLKFKQKVNLKDDDKVTRQFLQFFCYNSAVHVCTPGKIDRTKNHWVRYIREDTHKTSFSLVVLPSLHQWLSVQCHFKKKKFSLIIASNGF